MTAPFTEILRLARSGSHERAWSLMAQHGLLDSDSDARALTLQARLVKDRAKRAAKGAEQARLFDQSARIYAKAGHLSGESYPLINAASLSLFAGKAAQAERFARQVLSMIDADPDEGETPYWREATRAEALLVLGQEVEARAALRRAIAIQPFAWEDHAATLGQFALILAEKGLANRWLDAHRPPPSVHFSGIAGLAPDAREVTHEIEDYIFKTQPGFAFGALAAGADLVFAEAFLAWRDAACPAAELHVVLPLPVDRFRQLSVAAFGDHWLGRFDTALERATSLKVYGLDDPELSLAVEYADMVAMGRAVRRAQALQSRACAVTVAIKGEELRPQLASWRESGFPLTIIEGVRSGKVSNSAPAAPPNQKLQALVWARQAEPHASGNSGGPTENQRTYIEGRWSVYDDLVEAGLLAKELAHSAKDTQVALTLVHCDPDGPDEPLLGRVASLAAVAEPAMIVADEGTTMALIQAGWNGPIEELGELSLPSGREPIWSVA